MADTFVTVEHRADGVALVRLDRPKMNALSVEMLSQLEDVARQLHARPPAAVVITGSDRVFSAGAEISEFGGPDDAWSIGGHFRTALDAVAGVPRIVIAAISGYALGGGCELALACDFRVAAATAKLGQPEILLGIIPGGGGTQRLPRLVGSARAKELMVSGRQVSGADAATIGLVDKVVPAGEVLDAALAWAGELAAGPVVAHGLVKRAVDDGLDGSLGDGLSLERELFRDVFRTDDAAIGVKSFLENGPGKATFGGS
jgi:enoyl-CoA hydratase